MTEEDSALDPRIDARISLLREFGDLAQRWFNGKYDPEGRSELRRKINRLLVPARRAVLEAGAMKVGDHWPSASGRRAACPEHGSLSELLRELLGHVTDSNGD